MPGYKQGHRKKMRNNGKHCMLRDIKPGRCVKIRCHHSKGAIRQRLLDLGFVPETKVEVIRKAPLGDPIECCVANYKVALRQSEADLIEVESD